jgi:hypothetical protein
MSDKIFDNIDSIQSLASKTRKEELQKIQKDMGLKNESDFIILCAAVGLYKCALKDGSTEVPPAFKKLTNISIFEDRKLYDRIFRTLLDHAEPLIKDFNEYVWTGFTIIREWHQYYEPTKYKLDSWADFITKILASDDPLQDEFKPQQS